MAEEGLKWGVEYKLDKFAAGIEDVYAGKRISSTNPTTILGSVLQPYETIEGKGNLLMAGGADLIWLALKTGLSATTGLANTIFGGTAKGTAIGVGDSTTAAAISQTNLQAPAGSSNRLRKKVDTTYPTHTTGTAGTTQQKALYRVTYSTSQANFVWNEWGIFNSTGDTTGRMLNRKVEALGTKAASATWQFTVTLSLA